MSPRYEADNLLKLLYITEGFYLKIDDFWKKFLHKTEQI